MNRPFGFGSIEEVWNEIAILKAKVRPPEERVSGEVLELRDQVEDLHDLVGEMKGEIAGLNSALDGVRKTTRHLRNELEGVKKRT